MADEIIPSFGRSIANGAAWMVLLRFAIKSISIVSTLIIARLLVPEDFGLYALSMSIFSLVELIRAFGFGMALIQNQKTTADHYNTAWTLHIMFSFVAAAVLYFLAGPISQLVNEPRTIAVIEFLALVFMFDAFTNIGVIDFQKYMNFQKEFYRQVIIKVGGFAVTIPLVFIMRDYWALLYGTLATTVISLIISYMMHSFRPVLCLRNWKEMLHFSSWLQLNNILRYADKNLENFIVSRYCGADGVGLLSMSKEIGTVVMVELVDPINRAAYPIFARVNTDRAGMKETFFGVFSSIAVVALPIGAGIAILAPVFVPALLGEKWSGTVVLIQIVALASIFSSLGSSIYYVFLATAKQYYSFSLMLVKLLIFVPMMMVLIPEYGAMGAALSMLITSVVMFPITTVVLGNIIGFGVGDFFGRLLRPVLAVLIMLLTIIFALTKLQINLTTTGDLISLAILVPVGMLTYALSLILLWRLQSKPEGPESWALRLVQRHMTLPTWLSPKCLSDS